MSAGTSLNLLCYYFWICHHFCNLPVFICKWFLADKPSVKCPHMSSTVC